MDAFNSCLNDRAYLLIKVLIPVKTMKIIT